MHLRLLVWRHVVNHCQLSLFPLEGMGVESKWHCERVNFKLGINHNAAERNCCPNSLNKYWHGLKCPLPTAFPNTHSPAPPSYHGNRRIVPIPSCSHFKFCCSAGAAFPLHNGTHLLPQISTTTLSHCKVAKIRQFTTKKNSVSFLCLPYRFLH